MAWSSKKSRRIILLAVFFIAVAGISGLIAFRWHSANSALNTVNAREATLDLGITYLAITPSLAAYYGLGVDSGALVTAVYPDSPAADAGIKVGDVIMSFNGVNIKEGGTLLGMIRSCPAGSEVSVEVWRGSASNLLQLCYDR